MKRRILFTFLILILAPLTVSAQYIFVPMDITQTDHLKAYGAAFWSLQQGKEVEWLLNYKGGSFLAEHNSLLESRLQLLGVSYRVVSGSEVLTIKGQIAENNMEVIKLEKVPKIAIYTPPNSQPWDDAVTMALTYAEIEYETLWDEDVLLGKLDDFDWLHLHHEDFTGQYGKFYAAYGGTPWYIQGQMINEELAKRLGYNKVSEEKKAVARTIRDYVAQGGFLFAMCSAADSYDIALAAENTDVAASVYDGDPADPDAQKRLDFTKTFAFTDFVLNMNPGVYEYSDIDYPASTDAGWTQRRATDYFSLFEFSAKYDPVPTMLTQNHVAIVKGFMGQTTGFKRSVVKKSIVVLGEMENEEMVKYLHGNYGKGTFTFYGGHDPEDYTHIIGDPPTQLSLHRNSPGYRIILNNILFPAAEKKPRKTE